MRLVARCFLWLLTVAVPVVIAACYGPMYRFSKSGKVIDSQTKEGINNIQVTCLRNGYEQDVAYSLTTGQFDIYYDAACDELLFEDIDGEENGGTYVQRTVEFCEECPEMTVELHK
jgi:hypothetical protein